MYSAYRRSINPVWFIGGLVVVLLGLPIVWVFQHHTTQVITICQKERTATSGGGEYRIYAAEGTFVLKDSHIGTWRTNTADFYPHIKTKTTYRAVTKGQRIGLFSKFPNILELTELPSDQQTPEKCNGFYS